MKWFRRHIKTGSRLALFALAVQFALSFGHFHLDAAHAATEVQLQANPGDAQHAAVEAAGQQQPAEHHDHDRHPGAICAICAVVSMAQQVLFATPAALLPPDAHELRHIVTDAERARPSTSRAGFQSRAPPVS